MSKFFIERLCLLESFPSFQHVKNDTLFDCNVVSLIMDFVLQPCHVKVITSNQQLNELSSFHAIIVLLWPAWVQISDEENKLQKKQYISSARHCHQNTVYLTTHLTWEKPYFAKIFQGKTVERSSGRLRLQDVAEWIDYVCDDEWEQSTESLFYINLLFSPKTIREE
jgi:hypothetical protein